MQIIVLLCITVFTAVKKRSSTFIIYNKKLLYVVCVYLNRQHVFKKRSFTTLSELMIILLNFSTF